MASDVGSNREGPMLTIRSLIEQACDEFEAAWKGGRRPEIEAFLVRIDQEHRPSLLRELILIDAAYRRQHAERPKAEDYLARFPQDASLIEAVFQRVDTSHRIEPTRTVERPAPACEGDVSLSARYCQLRPHAEGGLGEVYRAQDDLLHREVAIKFLHRKHLENGEVRERLQIEAEVTARLDHPGVVPVYGIGQTPSGRPFYVMRFVEGESFREAIDRFHEEDWNAKGRSAQRMALRALLEHLIAATNAVAYGHNRGVLHRDIKPDNILLGRFGETFLVDWGLAQFVERDARAKASGEKTLLPDSGSSGSQNAGGAGTIGYMSPEQLPESHLPVGPASDVYSLGATLYKIVTGTTAFHWSEGQEVWQRILDGDFARPRDVKPGCPRALEAICLKAMSLRPQDRYPGAEEFAGDVRRWLADESVSVYRESWAERTLRVARRHQAWSFAGAIATVLLVVVGLLASLMLENRREAAIRARIANLRNMAAFAADTFGYEIDQRWRILGQYASDPELHALLKAASGKSKGSAEWTRLRDWVAERSGPLRETGLCCALCVLDRDGVQLARDPHSPHSVGDNFRYRMYFHGRPREPSREDSSRLPPTGNPVVSTGYSSTIDGGVTKVSFAVPIRDSSGENRNSVIGILAMVVKPGDFVRNKYPGVTLVDLRPDSDPPSTRSGQVLDHPELYSARKNPTDRVYISADLAERLERLRSARLVERASRNGARAPRSDALDMAYVDTLAGDRSPGIAAFEPVFVPYPEDNALVDIGWVVIVQDHGRRSEPAPAHGAAD